MYIALGVILVAWCGLFCWLTVKELEEKEKKNEMQKLWSKTFNERRN